MTLTSTSDTNASTSLLKCTATCLCCTPSSVWTPFFSKPGCPMTRQNASNSSKKKLATDFWDEANRRCVKEVPSQGSERKKPPPRLCPLSVYFGMQSWVPHLSKPTKGKWTGTGWLGTSFKDSPNVTYWERKKNLGLWLVPQLVG